MKVKALLILSLVLGLSFSSAAKVHEKLSVEASARLATHIIIASEGDSIDGQVIVEESLKGDLKPGENLIIPEMATLSSRESRAIECLFPLQLCRDDAPTEYVTGSRMFLFLKKHSPSANRGLTVWTGIGKRKVFQSTIWMEGRRSFAFYDVSKDERGLLAEFERSEEEIKVMINMALEK